LLSILIGLFGIKYEPFFKGFVIISST